MRCESLKVGIVLDDVYYFTAYVKNIITFFCPSLKNHYLGFIGVILSIQELQYEDNSFRQFCNPTFDRDNIIKSTA